MSSSSDSSDKYSNKLCEQRIANGDPCNYPALNGKRFCHYHDKMGPSPIKKDPIAGRRKLILLSARVVSSLIPDSSSEHCSDGGQAEFNYFICSHGGAGRITRY